MGYVIRIGGGQYDVICLFRTRKSRHNNGMKKYDQAFKREAIRKIDDGQSVASLAR